LNCKSAAEIEIALDLLFRISRRIVFNGPNVIDVLLTRAEELGNSERMQERLLMGTCGGGRSWSGKELDPQYKQIRIDAEKQRVEYAGNKRLSSLFRSIIEYEIEHEKAHQQMFAADDEEFE